MPDEPKIIIDEGWKAQVAREREEAARKAAEKPQEPATPAEAQPPRAPAQEHAAVPIDEESGYEPLGDEEELLEASFVTLVASLATQAMFALGVMAAPGTRQVMVNLDQAKFTIDTLVILRDKTKGNLDADEEANLDEALAELQRMYVARFQQWQEQALRQSGIDPNNLKGV